MRLESPRALPFSTKLTSRNEQRHRFGGNRCLALFLYRVGRGPFFLIGGCRFRSLHRRCSIRRNLAMSLGSCLRLVVANHRCCWSSTVRSKASSGRSWPTRMKVWCWSCREYFRIRWSFHRTQSLAGSRTSYLLTSCLSRRCFLARMNLVVRSTLEALLGCKDLPHSS